MSGIFRQATRRRNDYMADWESCNAVEHHPDIVSGAWVFVGTRVPIRALFENLRDGASLEDFLNWFQGVDGWKAESVLHHGFEALQISASS